MKTISLKTKILKKVTIQNNKTQKIPSIIILNIETKELIQFIKNCLKIKDFKIKEFRNKRSLYMNTLEEYIKARAYLEKTDAKFYTYTPKDLKTKSYLLKGLDADIPTQEIFDELSKYESDNLKILKVSPFTTKRATEMKHQLPIFLVQVTSNSNVNELKNIKAILYRIIKWEPVRHKEIPQCHNCQGFFHSSANCFLKPRCIKCNQEHEKGMCSIPKGDEQTKDKIFCVLCSKYGHP